MTNSKCVERRSKTYCRSCWRKHLYLACWEVKGNKKRIMGDNGRRKTMREKENSELRRKWFNEKEKQPLKLMKRTEVSWGQPRNREGKKHRVHLL